MAATAHPGAPRTGHRPGHTVRPRRYRLHLPTASPDGLRIAAVHTLLGLGHSCPVAYPVPDHEASAHRYRGDTVHRHSLDATTTHHVTGHPALRSCTRRLAAHLGPPRGQSCQSS